MIPKIHPSRTALLSSLGCAVTFGEPPAGLESIALTIDGNATAYSGIRRLLGDRDAGIGAGDFFGLTEEETFEDAARRMTTTNWWDLDGFESLASRTIDRLEKIESTIVTVRGANGADLPSLRVLLTAAVRLHRGRVRQLFVDVATDSATESLPDLARNAAIAQMADSAGARCATPSASRGGCATARDVSGAREFLFRNDDVALAAGNSALDPLLLPILATLRMQRFDLVMILIRELEMSDDPVRRARAGSMRAVASSRSASPAVRAGAHGAVAAGLRAIDGMGGEQAATERGWLHNADGLAFVIDYRESRDFRHLANARAALVRALGEGAGLTTSGGLALVQNATANAVRLLELERHFDDAFALLASTFPDVDEPALLYRRAMLHFRCGRCGAGLADLERAGRTLRSSQWPFRIAVLHAKAYGLERAGQPGDGADRLLEAYAIALGVRSRRCVSELAPSLVRALGRLGSQVEAASICDLLAAEGLDPALLADDGRPFAIDEPASKLPPYVPEIDLHVASDARQGINKGLDELIGAAAGGSR